MHKNKIINIGALGFLVNAAIYLTSEFIAALGTKYSLAYVYTKQFISALGVYNGQIVEGVPENFSTLAIVMNIGFIATAVGFSASYILLIFPKMLKKSKVLASILLLVVLTFSLGSILVGLYQGGVPGEEGLHGLGARLSFLMGNGTLLLTGIFLPVKNKSYKLISIFLGLTGFVAAYFLQQAILENLESLKVVYERITVYTITLWQLITGMTFIRKNNI